MARFALTGPATIRMIPTVWGLNPEVVTSTAKVRIAPTTSRRILTPRLIVAAPLDEPSERVVVMVLGTKCRFNEPALKGRTAKEGVATAVHTADGR
jgi:hypothetical protein